jgi:hypothetical protein
MEALLEWIDSHQLFVALLVYLFGGVSILPFAKKFAKLTPSTLDDKLVEALEKACGGQETMIVSEIERRLTDSQIKELVKLRKERIYKRRVAPSS